MTLRGNTLLVALLAGSLIGMVACGDDESTSGSESNSSSSADSSSSASSGGGGMGAGGMGAGGMADPCQAACQALFDCTQLMNMGMQICPGIPAAAETDLVAGCLTNPACGSIGGLVGDGTDPAMCASGIETVKGLSADFKTACEGGGAGGGGA